MAKKEANFDVYIQEQLRDAKIEFSVQGSTVREINEALKTASKRQTGKSGYPEFVAIVGEYVLVGENKPDRSLLCERDSEDNISLEVKATEDYAVNGALWYAKHIIEKTSYKKVFAFGNAGDSKHHILQPLFVGADGYVELDEVETFENFSAQNIEEYYRRIVLGETPPEDVELGEVLKHAKTLHEYLRTFGSLGEDEKPLVVSAILLALREEKEKNFQVDMLNGDTHVTDGSKLFKALESCFARAQVNPQTKRDRILNQFTLIKDRPKLNAKVPTLGDKTPLRYFTEFIRENIFNAVISNSGEDFLGRFYSEFVSYSGGDGQALGVVLTPGHITDLFCDLVDLKPDDVLFDPCCGTGGFLVAGMYRLLEMAQDEHAKNNVKEKQIHGIEDREDMFAIATTNMIFRGDGRSNLQCGDFFTYEPSKLQIDTEATVGLMNPPYSQGSKEHPSLYEICFIRHLLDSLVKGGRAAVIVPVSTMIGKSKEEKEIKKELLKRHTLEGVISCNKNTFYGVGTVPCIAVFTCGVPHPKNKLVKFVNFEDDGFVVKKHIGLVETERAIDRKKLLLDCWHGRTEDAPSKFMVQTTIEGTDEWIHAFYYYNDEVPTEQDFMNSIADYLTFEFNMMTRSRDYLFETHTTKILSEWVADEIVPLKAKEWGEFVLSNIFTTIQRGKRLKTADHKKGHTPYVSSTAFNNGVDAFISNRDGVRRFDSCLTIANSGSVGKTFYHPYEFIASDHVTQLKNQAFNQYIYLFLTAILSRLEEKYSFNREMNDLRIRKDKILLPVDNNANPDWAYMEQYAKSMMGRQVQTYLAHIGIK